MLGVSGCRGWVHPDTAWGWVSACRSSAEWAGHGRDGGDCQVSDIVGRKSRAREHLWQSWRHGLCWGTAKRSPRQR